MGLIQRVKSVRSFAIETGIRPPIYRLQKIGGGIKARSIRLDRIKNINVWIALTGKAPQNFGGNLDTADGR